MPDRKVFVKIEKSAKGKTLLSFLSERFSYHSSEEWERRISEGFLRVNEKPEKKDYILLEKDIVSYDVSSFKEPEVDANFGIVHDGEYFLIIDKSGNLPVHPSGPFFKNTLWWLLKARLETVRILTRLDRETSGLMVIAKTQKAAAKFAKFSSMGLVQKKYVAAVFGEFPEEDISAEGYLYRIDGGVVRKKLSFSVSQPNCESVKARTIFRKIASNGKISAVSAELLSGRTHQIRASLCSMGYPIVGDKLYGTDESLYIKFASQGLNEEDFKRLGAKRQMLHCQIISFPDLNGNLLEFESAPPKDMADVLPHLNRI
ncbi:MAG TPA: RluA family pseudouridine synthase [Victivallales bacterium]|nr:RluA family pseudouridine synthase [Victivallales bacterium]